MPAKTFQIDIEAIKNRIGDLVSDRNCQEFKKRNDVAQAIFEAWETAHLCDSDPWVHGNGKKSNQKPPKSEQGNAYSVLLGIMTNGTQNYHGWEIAAKILGVDIADLLQKKPLENRMITSTGVGMVPGDFPLDRLANIDVSKPNPRDGMNSVSLEAGKRRTLSFDVRAIFNTIRNEPLYDADGQLIAIADMELDYAYLIVQLDDPTAELKRGMGVDGGRVAVGKFWISYLGTSEGVVQFEVMPREPSNTLAGASENLQELAELDACFSIDDSIGAAFDANALRPKRIRYEESTEEASSRKQQPLLLALKQQVLARGISLAARGGEGNGRKLAARRFFMKGLGNEA